MEIKWYPFGKIKECREVGEGGNIHESGRTEKKKDGTGIYK